MRRVRRSAFLIHLAAALCALALLGPRSLEASGPVGAQPTLRVDPVELVQGRELPGRDDLFVDHAGYRYLFASDQNKRTFEAQKDRYEIQLGGACARMGPLSGVGSTDLFTVHEGRIYIFASEACRRTFLRDPSKVLESDEPAPTGTPEQRQRAGALLAKAIQHAGGAARLAALRSVEVITERRQTEGGTDYRIRVWHRQSFPDGYSMGEWWNEQGWADVLENGRARSMRHDGATRELTTSQARALERVRDRGLVRLLHAAAASDPALLAFADDSAEPGPGDAPTSVRCHLRGVNTTLVIDPASGRVLSSTFIGRTPSGSLATVTRRYTGSQTVDGLTLPAGFTTSVEGKDADAPPAEPATLIIDKAPAAFPR